MSVRNLLRAAAAFALLAPDATIAKEKHEKVERERTCICTMGQPGMPPMPAPAVAPTPGAFMFHMPVPPPDGAGVRVFRDRGGDVQVFRDGDEHRIVIYRTGKKRHDNADANRDGKITRREFLAKAEERFKKLDADGDGALSEEEAERHPMPLTVPLPPIPPIPPVPPTPPAPPAPEDE